jgi:hypothetical protein
MARFEERQQAGDMHAAPMMGELKTVATAFFELANTHLVAVFGPVMARMPGDSAEGRRSQRMERGGSSPALAVCMSISCRKGLVRELAGERCEA